MNIVDRINNKLKYTCCGEKLVYGRFNTALINALYECIMENVKELVDNMSTTEKQLVGNFDELSKNSGQLKDAKDELKVWVKKVAKDRNLADELIEERKGEE